MKINIDAMNRVLQEIVNGRMVRNHSIMLDTITQVDSMLPSEDDYPLNHTTLIFREIESKYIYRIVGMTSQEEECGDLIRYTFLKSDLQEFEFQFRKAKKASEESIITCIFILTSNLIPWRNQRS